MTYRVIAPYVTVRLVDTTTGVPTVVGFYQDAILPQSADIDNLQHLLDLNMVEEVAGTVSVEPETSESEPGGGEDKPPARVAPKSEWVSYAVSQGLSEDEANDLTKDELIERYKG